MVLSLHGVDWNAASQIPSNTHHHLWRTSEIKIRGKVGFMQQSLHTSEQISARDNAMHIMNNDTKFHASTTVRGPPRCKTFLCVVRYKRR